MKPNFRNRLHGLTSEQRLWAQVCKKTGPIYGRRGRCWIKIGCGEWYISHNGRLVRANRFSWELANGPVPPGLEVCHHCDNPSCVRPSHLFVGTHKQNMQDMKSKGRGSGGVSGPNNSSTKYPELRQGDNNGMRKLSSAAVKQMRKDRAAGGHTYRSLSEKYGVSVVTVNRIVNGRSWKHI